jgi:hypothetical protein
MIGLYRIIVWLHLVAAIGAFKSYARNPGWIGSTGSTGSTGSLIGAIRALKSSSYADINLGQFFTMAEFLDIYKGMRDPINGVFALENQSGVVQVVDCSTDVYGDLGKYAAEEDLDARMGCASRPSRWQT